MTPQHPEREIEREACEHEHSRRTGFVRMTMPVEHQRYCPDCGAEFWAIPANFGASFTMIGDHLNQGSAEEIVEAWGMTGEFGQALMSEGISCDYDLEMEKHMVRWLLSQGWRAHK